MSAGGLLSADGLCGIIFQSVVQKFLKSFVKMYIPAMIYLFKVNIRNTRKRCETCSKLTIKTPDCLHTPFSSVCIFDFEQVNAS